MWISKKKWQDLEKRVADLEGQVQDQPYKIVEMISNQLRVQMTKAIHPWHQKPENQFDEPV